MKLKIKITQEVLNATKMCGLFGFKLKGSIGYIAASNCAVTYACRELFPKCYTLLNYIHMGYGDEKITIADLPTSASNFILQFDEATPNDRLNMKPFEFEIELKEEAIELISIDEITKVLETSTTLEAV